MSVLNFSLKMFLFNITDQSKLIVGLRYGFQVFLLDSEQTGKLHSENNYNVYLCLRKMACYSLWVAVNVQRNRQCIFPSKILNAIINETFGDVFLRIFTTDENEENVEVTLEIYFLKKLFLPPKPLKKL